MVNIYSAFKAGTITDAPLSSGATQINSAGFSVLPIVAAPDILKITLDPLSGAGVPEICYVTTHTAASTQITVTRGMEQAAGGSVARSHVAATPWVAAITPADIGEIVTDQLVDSAITTDKLANNSVTTAKIASNTIIESDLALSLPARHGVQAISTVGTACITGATTGVIFDTEQVDTDGYHTGSSTQFVIPAGLGGFYAIYVCVGLDVGTLGTGGFVGIDLDFNFAVAANNITSSGAAPNMPSVSALVFLSPGGVVQATVRNNSGATRNAVSQNGSASLPNYPRLCMVRLTS